MPHLTTMNWDYLDQLQSASNGTFTSYYNYDNERNRTRKVVVKGNIREERYYVNGHEIFRKYTNNVLDFERKTINIFDDKKVFVRVEQKTGENPAVRYQYDNHLGSACLELDELGAIISYEEYHPFGTTSYRSGRTQIEVALKRYKYCGKERDEETGLYYYGARYYAAWLAKFISCDPLQHEYPHYTPYQYAGNKPITYIDLDGLEEWPNPFDYVISHLEGMWNTAIYETKDAFEYESSRDKYESAIKRGDIVYTKNYGWVDTTHAFETSTRDYVGANKLWNQILNETGKKGTHNGVEGFYIKYRQDAKVMGHLVGIEGTFFIKSGLSLEQKEQAALSIFQQVSFEFEYLQLLGYAIGRGDSAFEPADLPSNMLGFYMAVKPELTKDKIMSLIEPLSAQESLEIFNNHSDMFSHLFEKLKYKNTSFSPIYFNNKYSDSISVPNELNSIVPTGKNQFWWSISKREVF